MAKQWTEMDEERLESLEVRKDDLYGIEHPTPIDLQEIANLTSETLRMRDIRESLTGKRVG